MRLGGRTVRGPRCSSGALRVGGGPSTSSPLASDYVINLSSRALSYPGLAATRGGTAPTVWLQGSTSTIAAASTGTTDALYEDRGDGSGGGVSTFDVATNQAPSAFDMSSAGGWTINAAFAVVSSDGSAAYTDPTGGTGAQRCRDTSATATANNYHLLTLGVFTQSVWAFDWPGDTPTIAPSIIGTFTTLNFSMALSSAWTRQVESGSSQYTGIFPASSTSSDVVGVGSLATWGYSAYAGYNDLPLVAGTKTVSASIAFGATALSKLVDTLGNFDVELSYIVSVDEWDHLGNCYLLYATSTDGELSIRYDAASLSLIFRVRGVDVGQTSAANGPLVCTMGYSNRSPSPMDVQTPGQVMRVRTWYRPSHGDGGIRMTVNGCTMLDLAIVSTGSALAAPTVAYLGSNAGSSSFPARWQEVRRPAALTTPAPEGLVVGDSIMGPAVESAIATAGDGSYYYSPAQALTRPGIVSLAHAGDTIAVQKATFLASPYSSATGGGASVKWVVVQLGVNDVLAGTAAATILAALQDLVTTIHASLPSAKIALWQLLPGHAALTAPEYAVWQAVNAGIAAATITPVAYVGTSLQYGGAFALGDSSDNLLTQYAIGTLHPNKSGRVIQAAAHLAGLRAIGALP